ncbi:hypothetical protein [uncultured Tenacibaculum sp.]|uniref:hypothetical protein n=1 Tax=uncultured Tenacibaculum sp. TaxID=174713 RepID=UPI002634585F|nr:hypothetical protein [uncultured Tenacibaculum sp.]
MKNSILNIGKALGKEVQKKINGGNGPLGFCDANGNCPTGTHCEGYVCVSSGSSGGGNTGGGNTGGGNCVPDRFCVDEFDTCCIG